jgi:hypothetical protein
LDRTFNYSVIGRTNPSAFANVEAIAAIAVELPHDGNKRVAITSNIKHKDIMKMVAGESLALLGLGWICLL